MSGSILGTSLAAVLGCVASAFGAGATTLSLQAVDSCLSIGQTQLVVEVLVDPDGEMVVGGQFFLAYDSSKLSFVGAVAGDSPFTVEIYEYSAVSGQLDFAVGVPGGGPGTSASTVMARVTFNVLGEYCDWSNLVSFRPHSPPSEVTDAFGAPLLDLTEDLGSVTVDHTAPTISAQSLLTVNADPGLCTADIFPQLFAFNEDPALSATPAHGVFYVDRYAPEHFESAWFDGDFRLWHGIDASDYQGPGSFYNTQGRKLDINAGVGSSVSIDLYIGDDWDVNMSRADLWLTTFDATNSLSGYPILGFANTDGTPAGDTFRIFTQDTDQDTGNGYSAGWVDIGLPSGFAYGKWYTLRITLNASNYLFEVLDGPTTVLSFTDVVAEGSVLVGNTIIQAFNFGATYDVFWDNLTIPGQYPAADDFCTGLPEVTAVRSDLLPLTSPFPAGLTTVTWTASDDCGNTATASQGVQVDAFNTMVLDVALAGVVDPGPFTRCVTVEFGCGGPTVSSDVTFVSGEGVAAIDVPCGITATCAQVRDGKHTLRSTVPVTSGGGSLAVDALGVDALVGGNANGDTYVDILDFGIFAGQYGMTLGADTLCGYAGKHSDFDGDGLVDIVDFSFVQVNFLKFDEAGCCPLFDGQDGPITAIKVLSLRELGLSELAKADFNHDGVLDTADMALWMSRTMGNN